MAEHTDELDTRSAEQFIEDCRSLSDSSFLFIPGFEVPYLGTHVLALGAQTFQSGTSEEVLQRWQREGAQLVLAHPHRNNFRVDSFLKNQLNGVEIWNSQYDGVHVPRSRARRLFNDLQREGLFAFASIDLHRDSHVHGPRLVVDIPELQEAEVTDAIKRGAFTISRGNLTLNATGVVVTGTPWKVAMLGHLVPQVVGVLKACSSFLAKLGIRRIPFKALVRARL